jgi:hypothetical protein
MFTPDWQVEPDRDGLLQFAGLLMALTLVTALAPLR